MKIDRIKITNFRNFADATINFRESTLVIGANDVGKTNLFHSIRMLLDRSIPETELEPSESDFHVRPDGSHASEIKVVLKLKDITQDAVLARLKAHVNDAGETYIAYLANRDDLSFKLLIGHAEDQLEEIQGRYYLKSIHFNYIESARDLSQYLRRERRSMLRISKDQREPSEVAEDTAKESTIRSSLDVMNSNIGDLHYVKNATGALNAELGRLSHHNADYAVGLEAKVLDFAKFVDQLSLGATTAGKSIGLGGDGRNNQILLALWKAKSEVERDVENEALIYCLEEPESHLHPHQQRKLAAYLTSSLPGQVLVSTHSPHITSEFQPDRIVRLVESGGATKGASDGCSKIIQKAWIDMGYRMSVIPAEAFFSNGVFLVEGPSEVLFYQALARSIGLDLDFYNVCILAVNGIDFAVFTSILDAMEIPWVLRTDNDVSKVPRSKPTRYRYVGLNRALKLAGSTEFFEDLDYLPDHPERIGYSEDEAEELNKSGVYVSKIDLETDLAYALSQDLIAFTEADDLVSAIAVMQSRKAIQMGGFLIEYSPSLLALADDAIATPLRHLVNIAVSRRGNNVPH